MGLQEKSYRWYSKKLGISLPTAQKYGKEKLSKILFVYENAKEFGFINQKEIDTKKIVNDNVEILDEMTDEKIDEINRKIKHRSLLMLDDASRWFHEWLNHPDPEKKATEKAQIIKDFLKMYKGHKG